MKLTKIFMIAGLMTCSGMPASHKYNVLMHKSVDSQQEESSTSILKKNPRYKDIDNYCTHRHSISSLTQEAVSDVQDGLSENQTQEQIPAAQAHSISWIDQKKVKGPRSIISYFSSSDATGKYVIDRRVKRTPSAAPIQSVYNTDNKLLFYGKKRDHEHHPVRDRLNIMRYICAPCIWHYTQRVHALQHQADQMMAAQLELERCVSAKVIHKPTHQPILEVQPAGHRVPDHRRWRRDH